MRGAPQADLGVPFAAVLPLRVEAIAPAFELGTDVRAVLDRASRPSARAEAEPRKRPRRAGYEAGEARSAALAAAAIVHRLGEGLDDVARERRRALDFLSGRHPGSPALVRVARGLIDWLEAGHERTLSMLRSASGPPAIPVEVMGSGVGGEHMTGPSTAASFPS